MAQKTKGKSKSKGVVTKDARKPITTTVSPSLYSQIAGRAKRDGVKMATVARDLLSKWAGK